MSNAIVKVVARLVALPEKAESLKAILSGLIDPTRAEKGCLRYELLQNQADPTDFTFVEEWATEADDRSTFGKRTYPSSHQPTRWLSRGFPGHPPLRPS
jgi:hypothetical protein